MIAWLTAVGERLWTVMVTLAPSILGALVTVVVAYFAASLLRRWLGRALETARVDLTLARFFANLARYALLAVAVITALGMLGVETTSFAAVIAAAGLAIGLAFQGTLSNFAAGVLLLVFRPFRVGDVVTMAGVAGKVDEIALFTTELTSFDNRRIVIPNSKILESNIENATAHATRRVDVEVGVEYGASIDASRAALERAIASLEKKIDEPPPQAFLKALGASSVDWVLRVWCKTEDYWDVHQALVRAAKLELERDGISIPFPQLQVHLARGAASPPNCARSRTGTRTEARVAPPPAVADPHSALVAHGVRGRRKRCAARHRAALTARARTRDTEPTR